MEKEALGKCRFWSGIAEKKVKFINPLRNNEEKEAILVADLESDRLLIQLEFFVDAVHRFKTLCREDDLQGMSDDDLRKKAAKAPAKPKSSTTVVVYARNPLVAELAKRRAKSKCELCGKPAPFNSASDEPYLESHHIDWLAHGGRDSPENTVALCPNCHRKMHVVKDKKDIKKLRRRAKGKPGD